MDDAKGVINGLKFVKRSLGAVDVNIEMALDGAMFLVESQAAELSRIHAKLERFYLDRDRRGKIIAERVLGWKKHTSGWNDDQEFYAPSAEIASTILVGDDLSRFVDAAIDEMTKEAGLG